jgi:CRP-like cAMP-binding protein
MDFPTSNHILAALTEADRASLQPHLETVDLSRGTVIEEANVPPEYVYFPESGLTSVVAITPTGTKIEAGLYGREGMSGAALVHGIAHGPLQTFVQGPGSAQRISADRLVALMADHPQLLTTFLRWQHVFTVHVAHTALTNGRHTIIPRLARWILMSHDRLGDEIELTHDFLSVMLGVRRAGVTGGIHILEGEHLIKAFRGLIVVRDRAALEARAGDAYGVPEAYYESVWGRPISKHRLPAEGSGEPLGGRRAG